MEENKNLEKDLEVIEKIQEIGDEENPERREELCRELTGLAENEDQEDDICEKRGSGIGWGILGGAAVTAAYIGCRFAYKKGKGWLEKRKAKKKEKPIDTDYREYDDEDLDEENFEDEPEEMEQEKDSKKKK